jgi:hypothetical protein
MRRRTSGVLDLHDGRILMVMHARMKTASRKSRRNLHVTGDAAVTKLLALVCGACQKSRKEVLTLGRQRSLGI